MPHRVLRLCGICLLALSFLTSTTLLALAHSDTRPGDYAPQPSDAPLIDPAYIYQQLDFLATHFQRREAGYDANLPANVNGHDEFADYWSQEISHDLQDFGVSIQRDPFTIHGWAGRPPATQAFNVEATVPGARDPAQVVVIGCHYDGMAFSTQSANDDASGCAIELGVARAMADYWRAHHLYPARTLRFVLFDAEEPGLLGSYHYTNATINGDITNIVAMFNEEQNGIAYPVRYLGQMQNPLLPFYVDMSPLQNTPLYPAQDRLSATQRAHISRFRTLLQQALPAVFQQFRASGILDLTYHDKNAQDVPQPVFTADQLSNVKLEDDTLGSSDQMPFTLAGLPCATFVGNSTYYDQHPPAWSYPYDQPEDTLQLMNTFADGSSQQSNALGLALALPGMLTTWMLHQPDILGAASAPHGPIATISSIGQTQVGQAITLNAHAAFDPTAHKNVLTSTWHFGDGSTATGSEVTHTYTTPGTYTLSLTVRSSIGTNQVSKSIAAVSSSPGYVNPYLVYQDTNDGKPPANPAVHLPTSDDTLSDRLIRAPGSTQATPAPSLPISQKDRMIPEPFLFFAIVGSIGGVLVVIAGVIWQRRRTKRIASQSQKT